MQATNKKAFNSIEEWDAYRSELCSQAMCWIESLKLGVKYYIDILGYPPMSAAAVRAKHRSTYMKLKNEGWPTSHIKIVARSMSF